MDKESYIQDPGGSVALPSLRRFTVWGCVLFLLLCVPDFLTSPEMFRSLFIVRVASAAFLLAVYVLLRYVARQSLVVMLAWLAVAGSAGFMELAILATGGHRSVHFVGMILLGGAVAGFISARLSFHLGASSVIYAAYLVPILATEHLSDSRWFLAANLFFLLALSLALSSRILLNRMQERSLMLTRELDYYRQNVQRLIQERTAELVQAFQDVEHAVDEWKTTFDSSSDAILLLGEDFRIVRVNRAAAEFFRSSYRDLLDRTCTSVLTGAGIAGDVLPLPRMSETKKHVAREVFLPGRAAWITITADPILGYKNAVNGAVITIRDITEIKILQQSIVDAYVQWEETFNTINDAITVHDDQFNIVRANKGAEEMLNLPIVNITRRKCYDSYHGTDCPPEGCPGCLALKTGKPSTTEFFEPHLQKYLEVKALPRVDEGGAVIGLIHVVRDISDRKKAEEQLQYALAMTNKILEKAPFGIYVVNDTGRIEYVNPAMLRISGTEHEQFTGVNVFDLPSYQEAGLSGKILDAVRGTSFSHGPVEYTSFYGKRTTIRNFIGIPLEDRGAQKALVIVEDMTELSKAEEDRRHFQSQLLRAQRLDSIGRLAGGIAHDFNNILSSILGYSERALRLLPEDHPVREDIKIIADAGEKAASLTRQFLAFSRRQVLEMKVTNLNTVVDNLGKMLARLIGEDIDLQIRTDRPVRNIFADVSQIEQVIINLAVNARDAMPEGGRLVIETADFIPNEEFLNSRKGTKPGSYVRLTVADTGEGMSRETLEKIFEPFFTTKVMGKGTGLGLATTYGIVKQHNGYIWAESEPEQGTLFEILFPVVERELEESPRERPLENLTGTETVMVVDDDASIRTLMAMTLRPLGYNVLDAGSGTDAIELSAYFENPIHLLVTDVIMPGMSGKKLAAALMERRPDLKVIFISGYTDDIMSRHGILEGGLFLINKPFTPTVLAQKVREVLDDTTRRNG